MKEFKKLTKKQVVVLHNLVDSLDTQSWSEAPHILDMKKFRVSLQELECDGALITALCTQEGNRYSAHVKEMITEFGA